MAFEWSGDKKLFRPAVLGGTWYCCLLLSWCNKRYCMHLIDAAFWKPFLQPCCKCHSGVHKWRFGRLKWNQSEVFHFTRIQMRFFCAFRRSSATLDKAICSASQEGSCTTNTCMQKLSDQHSVIFKDVHMQYISFEQLILLPWHLPMKVSSKLSLVTGPC